MLTKEDWSRSLDQIVQEVSFKRWVQACRAETMGWLWSTEALYWITRDGERTRYQLSFGVKRRAIDLSEIPTSLVGEYHHSGRR